jgi:hypothetical protein
MAHYKRKRPQTTARKGYSAKGLERRLQCSPSKVRHYDNWPRWHDKLHHTRPTRRQTHQHLLAVLNGADPDEMTWLDGRKPHEYFW